MTGRIAGSQGNRAGCFSLKRHCSGLIEFGVRACMYRGPSGIIPATECRKCTVDEIDNPTADNVGHRVDSFGCARRKVDTRLFEAKRLRDTGKFRYLNLRAQTLEKHRT